MKSLKVILLSFFVLLMGTSLYGKDIKDTIKIFNQNPDKYPSYKVSLIIFLNENKDSGVDEEVFKKLGPFKHKDQLIKLHNIPELLVEQESLDEAFNSDLNNLITLEENNINIESSSELEETKKGLNVQFFENLRNDKLDLDLIVSRLKREKDYTIIYSKSWYQPIFSYDSRNFIHIDSKIKNIKVYGYISQYKEKYLHSEMQLRYSIEDENGLEYKEPKNLIFFNDLQKDIKSNNLEFRNLLNQIRNFNFLNPLGLKEKKENLEVDPIKNFSDLYEIKEERKIDDGLYNYFDHPYFGVLIKVESL